MAQLFGLIRDSYSLREARAWKAIRMTDPYRAALAEAGRDVLGLFKSGPGRCTAMTAVYVWRLRDMIDAPVFMVAGDLHAGHERVFGTGEPIDGPEIFSCDSQSWNGHAWLVLGPMIADISICRTAFSPRSPPALARHFRATFSATAGLVAADATALADMALTYTPRYVLTEREITGLVPRDPAHFK